MLVQCYVSNNRYPNMQWHIEISNNWVAIMKTCWLHSVPFSVGPAVAVVEVALDAVVAAVIYIIVLLVVMPYDMRSY